MYPFPRVIQSSSIFPIIFSWWIKAKMRAFYLARYHINSKYISRNTNVPTHLVTGPGNRAFTWDCVITHSHKLLFSAEPGTHSFNCGCPGTCQHLSTTYACHSLWPMLLSVCTPTRHAGLPRTRTAGWVSLEAGAQCFWQRLFLSGGGRAPENLAQGCRHQKKEPVEFSTISSAPRQSLSFCNR